MARLTIDLPRELGCDGGAAADRTDVVRDGGAHPGRVATGSDGRRPCRPVAAGDERDDVDASVRTFVSWVECWAGA